MSSPVDTPRDFRSVGVDGIFIRILQFGAGPSGLDDIPACACAKKKKKTINEYHTRAEQTNRTNRTNEPEEIIRDFVLPHSDELGYTGFGVAAYTLEDLVAVLLAPLFGRGLPGDEDGPEVAVNLGGNQKKQNKTKKNKH